MLKKTKLNQFAVKYFKLRMNEFGELCHEELRGKTLGGYGLETDKLC